MKDPNRFVPKNQLITELNELRNQIIDLKKIESNYRKIEKELHKMSETAIEVAFLPQKEDIYSYIGAKIKEYISAGIVGVNSIDEKKGTLHVKNIVGINKKMIKIIQEELGIGLSNFILSGVYKKAIKELTRGQLVKVKGGLYNVFFKNFPKKICKRLEQLLGISEIYSIGLRRKGALFGNVTIITYENTQLNKDIIETFVNQMSVVLERKHAEEAFQESEEKYRNLVSNLTDIIIETDSNLNFTYISPQVHDIYGYKPEEIIGKNIYDFIHPDDRKRSMKAVEEAIKKEQVYNFEFRTRHKDSHFIDVSGTGKIIEEGEDFKIIGLVRDITKPKLMEKAIMETKESYKDLAESIGDVFFALDNDLKYTYWNNASEDLTGISAKKALGKYILDVFPDNEETNNAIKVYKKVLKTQKPEFFINEYHIKNKHYYFEINAYPSKGGVSVIAKDITDRKRAEEALRESEQKYRNLVERADAGVVVSDIDGKLTYVNDALCKMGGYNKDEIIGKQFIDFIHPEDFERISELFINALANNIEEHEIEFRVIHKDGHTIHLTTKPTYIRDQNRLVGFIAIIMDITERKRAEDALEESEERLRGFMDSATDAFIILDSELNFIEINKAGMKYFPPGTTKEDVVGRNVLEWMPNLKPTGRYDKYLEVIKTGESFFADDIIVDPKLGEKHVIVRAFKVGDGLGSVATDITERKRAEEALQREKEFSDTAINTLYDTFFIFNPANGKAIRWNKKFNEVSGYTDEEISKLKAPESYYSKEDLIKAVEATERVLKGEEYVFSMSLITKQGKRIPFEYNSCIIPGDKKGEKYIVAIGRDITERKCAEEKIIRLSNAVKSSMDSIVISNLEGDILEVNEATLKLYNTKDKRDLIGKNSFNLIAPEDLEKALEGMQRVLEDGYLKSREYSILTKDGTKIPVEMSVSLMKDKNGVPIGFVGVSRDIIERKRAEEALRESEERLKEAQKMGKMGDWEFDVKSQKIMWSDQMFQLFGRDPKQGPPNYDENIAYYHPEDSHLMQEHVQRAIEHGETIRSDYRMKLSSGKSVYHSSTINPVMDDMGNVVKLAGTVQDITERKHAEEELKISQKRYELATKAARVGVWDWEIKSNKFYIDPIVKEILGYKDKEIPNDIEVWSSYIYPDDKKPVMAAAQACIDGKKPEYVFEHRMIHKDGSIRWVLTRGNVIRDTEGRAIRLIGTDADITGRKLVEEALRESEKKYKDLFEKSPEAILLINQDFKIIDCNDAAAKIGGLPKKDVVGNYFGEEIIPILGEEKEEYFDHFMKGLHGETVAPFEVKITNKKGETYWLETHLSPPEKYDENFIIQIIAHDITERKKTGEELKKYHEQLEDLVEDRTKQLQETYAELETFAYSVSHDLRAPLRGMQGFAQILLEDYSKDLDTEGKEYAKRIVESSKHMNKMIENLLSYSRLSRAELKLKPIDLNKILTTVINNLETKIKDTNSEVIIEHSLPEVKGHSTTLVQVISNLLINAITFVSPEVKPKVKIWSEEHNGRIRLLIEDNGIGIATEYHEKIFRIFERLHGIETYPGTGIGLAIVRKGMERMNGRVGVEANVGRGSRFWIELKKPRSGK